MKLIKNPWPLIPPRISFIGKCGASLQLSLHPGPENGNPAARRRCLGGEGGPADEEMWAEHLCNSRGARVRHAGEWGCCRRVCGDSAQMKDMIGATALTLTASWRKSRCCGAVCQWCVCWPGKVLSDVRCTPSRASERLYSKAQIISPLCFSGCLSGNKWLFERSFSILSNHLAWPLFSDPGHSEFFPRVQILCKPLKWVFVNMSNVLITIY